MSLPDAIRILGLRYDGDLLSCNGLYYNSAWQPTYYQQSGIGKSGSIVYNTGKSRWEMWDNTPVLAAYAPGVPETFPADSAWVAGYGFTWYHYDAGDEVTITRTGDSPCDYDPPTGHPDYLMDWNLNTGDGIQGGITGYWEFVFDTPRTFRAIGFYVGSLESVTENVSLWYKSGSSWLQFGTENRRVEMHSWGVFTNDTGVTAQEFRLYVNNEDPNRCGVGIHEVRFGTLSDKVVSLDDFEVVKHFAGTVIEINNVFELDAIRSIQNGLSKSYKQTANINASVGSYGSGVGFPVIGHDHNPFTGSYDGQGFSINNLFMNRTNQYYVGLFARNQGTIKRLCFHTPNISGRDYTGVLCGLQTAGGVIEDCYVRGGSVQGWNHVGGLVGRNNQGAVRRTYSNATVSGTGGDVGGLVGSKVEGGAYADENNFYVNTQAPSAMGSAMTDAQMKEADSYTGWNFRTLWNIDPTEIINVGYPYLDPRKAPQAASPGLYRSLYRKR